MTDKISAERDGFHHLVFVGLNAQDPAVLHRTIERLKDGIAAIVAADDAVLFCTFFGNHARFEDALHFGFHAVFQSEQALDAVRQRPDHIALMAWFEPQSNGQRTEINALVHRGENKGSQRPPGQGLLARPVSA